MTSAPPLADLHRHLDGSLRHETFLELADEAGVGSPFSLGFFPGMGLAEALAQFRVTLSVMQSPGPVRRVAAEMCEDAALENVTTLEIRFAPQLHRGGSVEEIVDAALDGIAGRAGLILCGLFGEDPEVLDRHVSVAASRPGVVGIDLAGGPDGGHSFGMSDYVAPFVRAAELGLGRTVHAGEGRPADEIRRAVENLRANRIGHGVSLLDDPSVTDLVLERGVVIEACLTSNLHTGVVASLDEHPLPRWLDRGVKACICADNTLLSGVTARDELATVATLPGMTKEKLAAVVSTGHAAAFSKG